jgi:ATP-dependent RNA helicase RhlE
MFFKKLGLQAELASAVSAQGYTTPTPIQTQAIPVILNGCDVLACAQTGTGKTAAFTLPILQLLNQQQRRGRAPRALVLTPTRELAAQVEKSIENYGSNLPLRAAVIFGGVSILPQIRQLRAGVDLMVATPGRLLDHVGQRTIDLSQVEILVLDEADRMLDMGFIHDIRRILNILPKKRQNLLFSATFSDTIRDLANQILHNPTLVEVARRNTTVETITQLVYHVARTEKRRLLTYLLNESESNRALVFIKTKHGANRLAQQLQSDGIAAAAIHSNKSQVARTNALADFKRGKINVLVATDIASRGLDIHDLPQVVNFDLPHVPEDYIHRIGRTGRAGANGVALSLVCGEERKLLEGIQRLLRYNIQTAEVPGFSRDDSYAAVTGSSASGPRGGFNGGSFGMNNFRKKSSGSAGRRARVR